MVTENDTPTNVLHSVVYSSTATQPFGPNDLQQLLQNSRRNNSRADLTGMLLYRGGRFIQILEGPEPSVQNLINSIRRDPRHTNMRILLREPIDERNFADWTMGYQPIGVPSSAPPEGYRDAFEDLHGDNSSASIRAMRQLTVWFRHRSDRAT